MTNFNELIFRIKGYSGKENVKEIKKPWGKEVIWASSRGEYTAKILVVNKDEELSLQYHRKKVETMLVLEGTIKLTYGKSINQTIVSSGTVIHIPAETIHKIKAVTTSYIVEVSTYDDGDVVRLQDKYDRK